MATKQGSPPPLASVLLALCLALSPGSRASAHSTRSNRSNRSNRSSGGDPVNAVLSLPALSLSALEELKGSVRALVRRRNQAVTFARLPTQATRNASGVGDDVSGSMMSNRGVRVALRDCLSLVEGPVLRLAEVHSALLGTGKGAWQSDLVQELLHALSSANSRHTLCMEELQRTGAGGLLRPLLHVKAAMAAASQQAGKSGFSGQVGDNYFPSRRPLENPVSWERKPKLGEGDETRYRGRAALHYGGAGKRRRGTLAPWGLKADTVVDPRGSGNFKRLETAIKAAPKRNKKPYIIYIKKGSYKLRNFRFDNTNITLVGDGPERTILWGDRSYASGGGLMGASNIVVLGDSFAAIGITFANTITTSQAVAITVSSDKAVFWNCVFRGYQDTLCAWSGRQLYKDCTIEGFVDFIFGNAAAVFQSSTIRQVYNKSHGPGVIMASGRTDRHEPTGLVFVGGRIDAVTKGAKGHLGRPWKEYSRMVYISTYMTDVVLPEGWLSWNGNLWSNHPYYAEYGCTGSGARRQRRVSWAKPGQLSWNIARSFLPASFVNFRSWIRGSAMPGTFFSTWSQGKK